MGLFGSNKQKETTLEDIKSVFEFLITEYGYQLVYTEESDRFISKCLLIYKSNNAGKVVEICAGGNNFFGMIRRITGGVTAAYSDKKNCADFESLAVLESENNYNADDYHVLAAGGQEKVLMNTAELFKRHSSFFINDQWLDIEKVTRLRNEAFDRKWNFKREDYEGKESYFEAIRKALHEYMPARGYELLKDSADMAPYEKRGMVQTVVYQKGESLLELTQEGWRDDYNLYSVLHNGTTMFTINETNLPTVTDGVKETLNKIEEIIVEK